MGLSRVGGSRPLAQLRFTVPNCSNERHPGGHVLTIPQSILAGATVIGACIVAAQFVAPYQMASGPALVWRVNRVTGEVRECLRQLDVRAPRIVTDCQ